MKKISEREFADICRGIGADAEVICRHNPIGTGEETILWMLLGCLHAYLSLTEIETPCFAGKPDAETYRNAIVFVLKNRRGENFDIAPYLDEMLATAQKK